VNGFEGIGSKGDVIYKDREYNPHCTLVKHIDVAVDLYTSEAHLQKD